VSGTRGHYHRRPVPRLPTLLLTCLVLAVAGCGGNDEQKASSSPAATAEPSETPVATPEDTGGEQGSGCEPVDKPKRKHAEFSKPKQRLDPAKTYVATVTTNCGEFEITLDAKRAPKTGGSFEFLAEKGFYDGLRFHRIVPGFVIQGGDPKGDGSGGPGYSIVEAPPEDLTYVKGVVAMAKTAIEDPGTSGSQFFIVTGDDAQLPPEYALLGKVTKGQDVVDLIGVAPVGPDEQPVDPIVIESVEVAES
jgi:cyclophilin family peptidyl-prolyl cis-trans isomerase